jgi:hypothetical protein
MNGKQLYYKIHRVEYWLFEIILKQKILLYI